MAKILLVEDDELNRECLSRLLVRRGFEVITAEDGETAIALAQSASPALILMDINLPGIDGYQATRAIRALETTGQVPIIALTAHAMASDRDRAVQAGCTAYETKPVELARLLGKIQDLLAGPPA
jgi:CheY-like chemotaxis protein